MRNTLIETLQTDLKMKEREFQHSLDKNSPYKVDLYRLDSFKK